MIKEIFSNSLIDRATFLSPLSIKVSIGMRVSDSIDPFSLYTSSFFRLFKYLWCVCISTSFVQSALIIFNDWASEQFNIYNNTSTVEVEWSVGSIPIDDNAGKEVIIRYDTDIASASKYYTDANGREVLERIRDYRPTWNYMVSENVSANYYPINNDN